jgi:uroporphyrinogen decarboxylase
MSAGLATNPGRSEPNGVRHNDWKALAPLATILNREKVIKMRTSASTLTSSERLWHAIEGIEVDRPPVSVWRHFPNEDQTAEGLAAATLSWQNKFDFDFVKFMPPGDYNTIDFGAESSFRGAAAGTRVTTKFPVYQIQDWSRLEIPDVHDGFHGVMLRAVTMTRKQLDPEVPLLQTVFSPLTMAMKLSDGHALDHLRHDPEVVMPAIERLSTLLHSLIEEALAAGADGIFYAIQVADRQKMSDAEYQALALPYDLNSIESFPSDRVLMLHLHGEEPMHEIAKQFPNGLVNWHDRRAGHSLADGHQLIGKSVAGGIDERSIATATAADVTAEVENAISQMAGKSLVVAPGCVVPTTTPVGTITTIVEAVKGTDV